MVVEKGISDEDLMLAVKKGDLTKLADLFERYHERIYRFFFRLTVEKNTSEELAQQVFYRMIHYRQSYKEGRSYFRPWIYQIARNLYYDYQKEAAQLNKRYAGISDAVEQMVETEGLFVEADYEKLDKALLSLDISYRELIIMRCYQDLEYEEIAGIINKSEAAVRVQLHRAMKALRIVYFKENY